MADIRLNLLLGAITASKLILGFLAWLVSRSHSINHSSHLSQMNGSRGKAVTDVDLEGRVTVQWENIGGRAHR